MGSRRVTGVMFLVVSLLFLCLGAYVTFFSHKGYEETTAVISRMESVMHNGKNSHRWFVTYEVDGTQYEAMLNTSESSYRRGKEIKVYYDPDDPTKVSGDSTRVGYIVMGVGGVSLIFSIMMIAGLGTGGRNYG